MTMDRKTAARTIRKMTCHMINETKPRRSLVDDTRDIYAMAEDPAFKEFDMAWFEAIVRQVCLAAVDVDAYADDPKEAWDEADAIIVDSMAYEFYFVGRPIDA
jgi:hypothetical protein